ncbi:GNAT family N-acetyltransferase [Candidatus Dojkabacteria bacterium]|uniref:GNAT family N-acetyltransferase n=1 Tax=Candidatus Dojkabacteria bacterium TaxID=2099670 RepID=A0A847D071_9BACT|nr:GNAT family N-acetyltransferase [Candidatus Dojkabacteria bacterium]
MRRYKISQMQEKDIPEVINFHNNYLGERDFINERELLDRLESNRGIFLVAKDEDEKIVGIKLSFIENDVCLGRGVAVDKNFRRLGIGKELVSIFELELKKFPGVKKYVFASSTQEGVPFHIKLGYKPLILLQSENNVLLEGMDFNMFTVREKLFNKEYNVYQVYLESDKELDLNFLSKIKAQYPELEITYLFEKIL